MNKDFVVETGQKFISNVLGGAGAIWGSWPGYMDCYYGFWSNPIEDWSGINTASIPPKKPPGPGNRFINNKILMNLK